MLSYTLNAKFIPPDHRVWLVYSGPNRKFFPAFKEHGCVFLEIPGFDPAEDTFSDTARIRQHLAMSWRIREYLTGAADNPASRTVSLYPLEAGDVSTAKGRRFNAEVGNIISLFGRLKPGDLVLSPSMGHYDPMLIGEVVSKWVPGDQIDIRYQRAGITETVPIRRVRWIRQDISRRDFPTAIAKMIWNRHAISELDTSFYDSVYKVVYNLFVSGVICKADFRCPKYSSNDPLETYEAAFLIKYLIAAFNALHANKIDYFRNLVFDDAVNQFFDPSSVLEFSQSFQSPGRFTLVTVGLTMLALIVGFATTLATRSATFDELRSDLQVSPGTFGGSDEALDQVRDSVQHLIDGIGRHRFEALRQRYGAPAQKKLDLRTDVEPDSSGKIRQ